jgi:hypothetical protein
MGEDNKRRAPEERVARAADVEEVRAILVEGGVEVSAEEAEELLRHAKEIYSDGMFLSADELEAVAGGEDRDFLTQGYAATVELGSSCWSSDGGCWVMDVSYSNLSDAHCPNCGKLSGFYDKEEALFDHNYRIYYHCHYCRHTLTKDEH